MRWRPLGWELACLLVVLAVLVVGRVFDSSSLLVISMRAAAIAAPLVLVSFLVRLLAGIVDEDRRTRTRRALARR